MGNIYSGMIVMEIQILSNQFGITILTVYNGDVILITGNIIVALFRSGLFTTNHA